jgi:hypothetical protein
MNQFILVSQSFGKKSEYRRVILAFLTMAAHLGNDLKKHQFVLFTDNPDFFKFWLKDLNVRFVLLTKNIVKVMRGEIDFLNRMKIALIEESFSLYPNQSMFYIDSDTFFIDNTIKGIEQVAGNKSLMHLLENAEFYSVKGRNIKDYLLKYIEKK